MKFASRPHRLLTLALVTFALLPSSGRAATLVLGRPVLARASSAAYRVVDLSATVGGGAVDLVPTAINNAGQIVGYDGGPGANGNAGAAYLINPDGTVGTLGGTGIDSTLYVPTAISNVGKSVAGRAVSNVSGDGIATWSLKSRTTVTQNYVSFYGFVDPAIRIASGNVPVGGRYFYDFTSFGISDFPSSGCAITDFYAQAINDAGTIVGSGGGYAAYGSTTGCATPIAFPRPADGFTQAHAINSAGHLIGSFTGPAAPAFGTQYLAKGTRLYRIALPAARASGAFFLVANAIGDNDDVVGNILSQTPPFAPVAPFLYRGGVTVDANALLPANSGWTLLTATGVAAGGEIIGTGYHAGVLRGYALKPL